MPSRHSDVEKMSELNKYKIHPWSKDIFKKTDGISVCWLGSAGFLLNLRGRIVMIDPVLSIAAEDPMRCADTGLPLKKTPPLEAKDVPHLDDLFYTHADRDHLGPETVKCLSHHAPCIHSTLYACHRMAKYGIDPQLLHFCRAGDVIRLNDEVSVEVIPADHPWQLKDTDRFGRPYGPDDCVGFVIRTPAGGLLFPGDSRLLEAHGRLGELSLIAMDVSSDPYHMGKQGSVYLANHYRSALLIPCHYATFDVDEPGYNGDTEGLAEAVLDSGNRLLTLEIGEILELEIP